MVGPAVKGRVGKLPDIAFDKKLAFGGKGRKLEDVDKRVLFNRRNAGLGSAHRALCWGGPLLL